MAEQLKVFFNGTFTSTDLTGSDSDEFVIIQNDNTTQAVIRDVYVDSEVQPELSDGTAVTASLMSGYMSIGSNVNLSGTEILDVSSTLKYKLDVKPTTELSLNAAVKTSLATSPTVVQTKLVVGDPLGLNKSQVNYPVSAAISDADLIETYFNAEYTTPVETQFSSVPGMSNIYWFFTSDSRAYYFNSNGSGNTALYTAEVTGTTISVWNAIDGTSYSYKAYDIENNAVWWVNDRTLYKHDCAANTTDEIGSFSGAGAPSSSTYSCAGVANGVFMYTPANGTLNKIYYYDSKTEEFGVLNTSNTFALSTHSTLSVVFNPDENKYYVCVGYSTNISTFTVGGGFSNGNTLQEIASNSSFFPNNKYDVNGYMQGNAHGELFIVNINRDPEKLLLAGDVATSVEILTTLTPYTSSGWFETVVPESSPLTNNILVTDLDINLKCKVSGVEITGV